MMERSHDITLKRRNYGINTGRINNKRAFIVCLFPRKISQSEF